MPRVSKKGSGRLGTSQGRGVTLLEILVAMLILGLITGGIFTAFVVGRRVSYRSEADLMVQGYLQEIADELRLAVGGASPRGFNFANLTPGVWVDEKLGNAGNFQGGGFFPPRADAQTLAALNLAKAFETRYQTDPGTANTWRDRATDDNTNRHGDGVILVVERADENNNGPDDEDLDGDGIIGLDLNKDRRTDLRRVRIRIKWTTPAS